MTESAPAPDTPRHTPQEERAAARASDVEREQLRAENSRDAEQVPEPEPSTSFVGSSGVIPPTEIAEGLAHHDALGSPGAEADQQVAQQRGG